MRESDMLVAAVLDEAGLTLDEFARACAVEPDWVVTRVREGLLPTAGTLGGEWRFGSVHLRRAREMARLERDFDAVPELAALVADLIDEVETLRGELRRAGLG